VEGRAIRVRGIAEIEPHPASSRYLRGIEVTMRQTDSSWLTRRIQWALNLGFMRAYRSVKVDPHRYILHLRRAHGLPINTLHQVYSFHPAALDHVADQTIKASMKLAAAEGAGFGVGGLITIVPEFSVLAAITLRMMQKLSLIYGFAYSTDAEVAELWIATASAAGVDVGKDFLEKEVLERFVPRIVRRIAVKAGTEVAEKWSGRLLPVLSSAIGGTLNYYFVREWGHRAKRYFREKHLSVRAQLELERTQHGQLPAEVSIDPVFPPRQSLKASSGMPKSQPDSSDAG
jgi:hypothetical protein